MSFLQLSYHIVFATKYRKPWLKKDIRDSLYEEMSGLIRQRDGRVDRIGGIEDHVHLLANLPAHRAISDVIRETKALSTIWLKDNRLVPKNFRWQKGYAAFTVSQSVVPKVRTYIENQEAHHRQKSFQDELIELLQHHGISYRIDRLFDDEYVT